MTHPPSLSAPTFRQLHSQLTVGVHLGHVLEVLDVGNPASNHAGDDAAQHDGPRKLEDDGHHDRVPQLEGLGAHGRGERVGDIVGA